MSKKVSWARRRFSDEFKRDAVDLVVKQGYSFRATTEAVNVSSRSLREWLIEGLTPIEVPADTAGDGRQNSCEKAHDLDSGDPAGIVATAESNSDRHVGYSYIKFYLNELADNLSP